MIKEIRINYCPHTKLCIKNRIIVLMDLNGEDLEFGQVYSCTENRLQDMSYSDLSNEIQKNITKAHEVRERYRIKQVKKIELDQIESSNS